MLTKILQPQKLTAIIPINDIPRHVDLISAKTNKGTSILMSKVFVSKLDVLTLNMLI